MLLPQQDVVIAEPEVNIYPLSSGKGMDGEVNGRFGVLYTSKRRAVFHHFLSDGNQHCKGLLVNGKDGRGDM